MTSNIAMNINPNLHLNTIAFSALGGACLAKAISIAAPTIGIAAGTGAFLLGHSYVLSEGIIWLGRIVFQVPATAVASGYLKSAALALSIFATHQLCKFMGYQLAISAQSIITFSLASCLALPLLVTGIALTDRAGVINVIVISILMSL